MCALPPVRCVLGKSHDENGLLMSWLFDVRKKDFRRIAPALESFFRNTTLRHVNAVAIACMTAITSRTAVT